MKVTDYERVRKYHGEKMGYPNEVAALKAEVARLREENDYLRLENGSLCADNLQWQDNFDKAHAEWLRLRAEVNRALDVVASAEYWLATLAPNHPDQQEIWTVVEAARAVLAAHDREAK